MKRKCSWINFGLTPETPEKQLSNVWNHNIEFRKSVFFMKETIYYLAVSGRNKWLPLLTHNPFNRRDFNWKFHSRARIKYFMAPQSRHYTKTLFFQWLYSYKASWNILYPCMMLHIHIFLCKNKAICKTIWANIYLCMLKAQSKMR